MIHPLFLLTSCVILFGSFNILSKLSSNAESSSASESSELEELSIRVVKARLILCLASNFIPMTK